MTNNKLWIGRIVSGLVIAFLAFDAVIHILNIAPVVAAFAELGYPNGIASLIGTIELVCVLLYLIPRTSILGAILLTGYLGGAVASHLRVGSPLFSTTLFPVYVGILVWFGLWIRNEVLQTLIPLKKSSSKLHN